MTSRLLRSLKFIGTETDRSGTYDFLSMLRGPGGGRRVPDSL